MVNDRLLSSGAGWTVVPRIDREEGRVRYLIAIWGAGPMHDAFMIPIEEFQQILEARMLSAANAVQDIFDKEELKESNASL